jgi:hypothetical protein
MAEPVALGIKPPTPTTLADMINIARGAQAYQQAEEVNPLALQKTRMEIEQAQKLNPLAVREKAALATSAETGATKGQSELGAYYRDQRRKTYGGLLADKDFDPLSPNPEGMVSKLQEANDYLKDVIKVPPHEGIKHDSMLEHIKKHGIVGAQRVIQDIANGVQQSGTTSEQFAQANRAPVAYDVGGKLIQATTSPYQKTQVPRQTEFGKTLAPSQRMVDTGNVDASNNPIFNVLDENGQVVGQTTVPSSVPPSALPGAKTSSVRGALEQPNAIMRIPAGQSAKSGEAYLQQQNDAREAVTPAKIGLQNIDTIIKYLPLASTGQYSQATAGLQSVLGNVAGSKPNELAAAARDIIDKTIADLAIQKNSALSGKFAASLEAAKSSLASAEKNPTAIAKSMEQLRPLLQHIDNYSTGLDKAIEKSPNKLYVKPEFDAAINKAFDMKALLLNSAYEKGGAEGAKKYAKDNNISVKEQENLLNNLDAYEYLKNGDLAGYKSFMANLARRK